MISFGLHLDVISVTVDAEIEKQNLLSAAKTLATNWSGTVIDGHGMDSRAMTRRI